MELIKVVLSICAFTVLALPALAQESLSRVQGASEAQIDLGELCHPFCLGTLAPAVSGQGLQ